MSISSIVVQFDKQLSLHGFMTEMGFSVDQLYMDMFWNSVKHDKWIYVGNGMLKWIGYSTGNISKHKQRYVHLLEAHFTQEEDYKHLGASEMKKAYDIGRDVIELPNDFNHHNKAKHLIVAPDCFTESLMLIRTDKAKEIRAHYLTLDNAYKSYMRYCEQYNNHQLLKTKTEIEAVKRSTAYFKQVIIKKASLSCDQYIYVATNSTYAKNNIFKIGMTTNIETQISEHATDPCANDQFSYVYIMKCIDAKALQKYIFVRLKHFRYSEDKLNKRELFQIHFSLLMTIMREFELFEKQSTPKINDAIAKYYDTYDEMKPMAYDEIIIEDIGQYVDDRQACAHDL